MACADSPGCYQRRCRLAIGSSAGEYIGNHPSHFDGWDRGRLRAASFCFQPCAPTPFVIPSVARNLGRATPTVGVVRPVANPGARAPQASGAAPARIGVIHYPRWQLALTLRQGALPCVNARCLRAARSKSIWGIPARKGEGMTHYVGPRATISARSGEQLCPRCVGRGFRRYDGGGRPLARASYASATFWRSCSQCHGTGHVPEGVASLAA